MSHVNTVLGQILKMIPRHEFETLANQHHTGRRFRTASRWSQFVAMTMAQLSGRSSLRDVISNLQAQSHRLYHLGSANLSRSNLARINKDKSYALYEGLFAKLLVRCQPKSPGHGFRFNNKLYSLDASTIDLCLNLFPWANFRTTKGAVKLHVGLDHQGYLPTFVTISDGKTTDIEAGRSMDFPSNSIVVCDRGYNDYSWYKQLTDNNIYFVTRLKKNANYRIVKRFDVTGKKHICSDQLIEFTGVQAHRKCPIQLRRVGYRDPETKKHYVYLTNNMTLSAQTIADIYKKRWEVELFFKWIKQNLKIKKFLGTSKNAVMTQIWVAMCIYLLVCFMKFESKLNKSMQQIIRLLHLNLFEKRDLLALLRGDPPTNHSVNVNQTCLL